MEVGNGEGRAAGSTRTTSVELRSRNTPMHVRVRVRVRVVGAGRRGKHLPALVPLQNKHSASLIGCRLAEWVERAWGCGEMELGHQPSGIPPR